MAKQTNPKVSVIMPVYNTAQFLKPALESILEQTFTDFELIAINDGSTDSSGNILDEYKMRDSRLIVVHQDNQGVVATANTALGLARGKYIARQDSDDASFNTRLEKQVAILDTQPEVVLVTGCFEVFDEDDEHLYREILPAEDEDIKRAMYLRNPIGHGSTLIRSASYADAGLYGDNGDTRGIAEDYELFSRLATKGKFMGVESATYKWRINTRGITYTQNQLMAQIMKGLIDNLWTREFPRIIGSRELRLRGRHYCLTYDKRGIAMKNTMLADNAQLAVKMVRRGKVLRGIRQLLAVMLASRSGAQAVFYKIYAIQRGMVGAIWRRTFGRQDNITKEFRL